MATDRAAFLAVPAAAAMLLWPALWNGYPIVFADSGTYLSQAIQHYAGWDRPVFYSLFMLPLHATVTVWPVVVAQALLTAWVLWRVCRALVPDTSVVAFVVGAGALSICTWLPWIVSELMPDLFTPLLILLVGLLAWLPERLSFREQVALVGLSAFMIASQQSSLPLACGLGVVLTVIRSVGAGAPRAPPVGGSSFRSLPWRPQADHPRPKTLSESKPWMVSPDPTLATPAALQQEGPAPRRNEPPGPAARHSDRCVTRRPQPGFQDKVATLRGLAGRGWVLTALPPVLAVLGMCTVNLAAHGRFAISPFGNVFLLARVIYDGPGMSVLRRECPTERWRLCPFLASFPATSDDFLWTRESPLNRAGGPKAVSKDAGAIIRAALLSDPAGELRAATANMLEQMTRFDSGDGLNPWPAQVSPWIEQDFPARELAAYSTARQQAGLLSVPPLMARLHKLIALGGVLTCALVLPVALRRRAACSGFLLAVLLALPLSAAITGSLSTPHDRYQARIMWLPPFVAVLSLASLRRLPA